MEINPFEVVPRPKNSCGKTIFLMKLSSFLYLVFSLQLAAFSGFSQNGITLGKKNSPLKSIIRQIEEQTPYIFILNNDEIDVEQNFSIKVIEKGVAETVALLFENSKILYKIKRNHIILSRNKEKSDDFTVNESHLGLPL